MSWNLKYLKWRENLTLQTSSVAKRTSHFGSSVTQVQVTVPCGAPIRAAAARAQMVTTASRTSYGQASSRAALTITTAIWIAVRFTHPQGTMPIIPTLMVCAVSRIWIFRDRKYNLRTSSATGIQVTAPYSAPIRAAAVRAQMLATATRCTYGQARFRAARHTITATWITALSIITTLPIPMLLVCAVSLDLKPKTYLKTIKPKNNYTLLEYPT